MTFSTATIQGKVMWIEMKKGQGKNKDRVATSMLISVPDKKTRNESGGYDKSTTYQVRVWDNQAASAINYIEKYQTITVSGTIQGINDYNPEALKINMDFATIIDYGYKQPEKKEGRGSFIKIEGITDVKEKVAQAVKK